MKPQKKVCHSWFATRRITDELLCINEIYYWEWNRANIWFIKGETQDLLIDTGLGVASLRQHLASLIDKPLLAVASHVHFDHAGGLHEFEDRAIHEAEAKALCSGDKIATLTDPSLHWILDEHFTELPYSGFTASQYTFRGVEATQVLENGDVIDLGNRAFEVLHLPGHSPGAIALYDPIKKELFSGDVVYDGELLDQLPGSDPTIYQETYRRLQKVAVEAVFPGHYRSFGKDRLQELIADYLEAKRQPGCPHEFKDQST
ncbi:metallo-beta-lactamase domain containing 2 [Halothece sp. PCC 7418]|uniref:MBL fold metallo-hydrolase n=1 Tax=Halothece sp. (strain PCC 7418) TaxID=65093 RepID=UPI0002A07652|nr:MBL fold metallo-hydrolase [Halothece sp. PCC 7418]AFZ45451.1 metallo-beta-lactamase domain containing 2 [Halothece sp. PCC 7418]